MAMVAISFVIGLSSLIAHDGPNQVLVLTAAISTPVSEEPDETDPSESPRTTLPSRVRPEDPPESSPRPEISVKPGDNFWALAARLCDYESNVDLVLCWSELVDINRDRLSEPGNPDLIHPGEEFRLGPIADAGDSTVDP